MSRHSLVIHLHVLLALLMLQHMAAGAPNLTQLIKQQVHQQQQQHQQQHPSQQHTKDAKAQATLHAQHFAHEPESLTEHQDIKALNAEEDALSDTYQMLHELKQEARLPDSPHYPWNPYAAAAAATAAMPHNAFENGAPGLPMPKMLPFIGYAQPVFIPFPLYIAPDMYYPTYPGTSNDLEDEAMSRASHERRPAAGHEAGGGYQRNSPIYYVRLPPTPYMFLPNVAPSPFGNGFSPLLTYQPMPTFSTFGSVFNLPVNFLANGKPSGIYQMNNAQAGLSQFGSSFANGFNVRPPTPSNPYRPTPPSYVAPQQNYGLAALPAPQQDSKLTSLKRPFLFNGRPEDIYILPNNFNTLYNEPNYY